MFYRFLSFLVVRGGLNRGKEGEDLDWEVGGVLVRGVIRWLDEVLYVYLRLYCL